MTDERTILARAGPGACKTSVAIATTPLRIHLSASPPGCWTTMTLMAGRRRRSPRPSIGTVAVGDVRRGNIKRVASAVGEGSIAIASSIRCFTNERDGRRLADRGEIGPSAQHEGHTP